MDMNIYLISNESYRLLNKEVKKIVKDNKYEIFNLNKCSIIEVLQEASYLSLDSDMKYLVVNNANFFGSDKLSEQNSEEFLKYLNNPNPKTVLIFTTQEKLDLRKKIVKLIKDKYQIINEEKKDKLALNNYLTSYVKGEDFNIDYQSVNYIINNSYNNLDIMLNELDKIMLYYNFPCTIKYNDVLAIIGNSLDNNNFHFVAAVVEKKLADAIKLLNSLKVYKVDTTVLIALLAREYRLTFYVKRLYEERYSLNDICRTLRLVDWQVNKIYNNSLHYSDKELLKNLVLLCDADMNIKKGIWDKDVTLYGLLLEFCS